MSKQRLSFALMQSSGGAFLALVVSPVLEEEYREGLRVLAFRLYAAPLPDQHNDL